MPGEGHCNKRGIIHRVLVRISTPGGGPKSVTPNKAAPVGPPEIGRVHQRGNAQLQERIRQLDVGTISGGDVFEKTPQDGF